MASPGGAAHREPGGQGAWAELLWEAAGDWEALAVGVFSASGEVLRANAALGRLLEAAPGPAAEAFVNPSFAALVQAPATGSGPVFRGVLTLGDRYRSSHSLDARVWRRGGELLVVGEPPVAELERATTELLDANQSISNLHRSLAKSHAELRRREQALEESLAAQQRALGALEDSERRFRRLTESAPVGIFTADADGRLTFCNPRWAALTRRAPEDLLGRRWLDCVEPADREGLEAQWQRLRAGADASLAFGARLDGHGAAPSWVLGSLVAEEDPRGGRSYIGSVADVTERMRLEREAAYGRRLEAMIRSVGRIAHEFNNALMSMLGYSDLARMRAERAGLDDVARWLAQSREATERAQALVAQMVQYARGGRASAAATDLGELVAAWAADARARGALQGCTLTVAAEPGLPPVVLDPDELRVILDNLLANAVDAAGGGGHVDLGVRLERGVDAECVISHRRVQGDRVVVEMRDDGPGMAPQVLDRIFDPFFTTKEVDAGVGLGLSVVEGLLRSMGAGALVESAPGRGTAIRLLFLPAEA